MSANGASVERDPVRACMWLELARTGADSGFTRELHARQRDERLVLERREVRRLTRRFMEASTPVTVDSMVMT